MITSKQRAYLRSLASHIDASFQLGKEVKTDAFVKQLETALEKRELIKITVLDTAMVDIRETAEEIAKDTRSNLVQVIGKKVVLYRPAKHKKARHIELPSAK